MNPYLFIVGCPRSGTTLLRRMVDAHPQIAIPSAEQHWILSAAGKGNGVAPDGPVTPALISEILEDRRFAELGIGREELESLAHGPVPYERFVSSVFDLYARRRAKPLSGDKTPGAVQRLATLHQLWPKARFVHLIRDGRDVILSLLAWRRASKVARRFATWSEHPVMTAALWWEWQVRLGSETGDSLGPEVYTDVAYEALVTDPGKELESLCVFLDLPFDEAMLRFHEGRRRHVSGLSAKKAWLPPTPGLRDWRTEMTALDVERFEAVAGNLLDDLGYPRAVPEPSAPFRALADDLRRSFIEVLRSRGRPVPEGWCQAAGSASGPPF